MPKKRKPLPVKLLRAQEDEWGHRLWCCPVVWFRPWLQKVPSQCLCVPRSEDNKKPTAASIADCWEYWQEIFWDEKLWGEPPVRRWNQWHFGPKRTEEILKDMNRERKRR